METAPAPAEGAPKELTKSQLKKLAKQKNAKPKMSKEEKMKAVDRVRLERDDVVGLEGQQRGRRRQEGEEGEGREAQGARARVREHHAQGREEGWLLTEVLMRRRVGTYGRDLHAQRRRVCLGRVVGGFRLLQGRCQARGDSPRR